MSQPPADTTRRRPTAQGIVAGLRVQHLSESGLGYFLVVGKHFTFFTTTFSTTTATTTRYYQLLGNDGMGEFLRFFMGFVLYMVVVGTHFTFLLIVVLWLTSNHLTANK